MALTAEEKKAYAINYLKEFVYEIMNGDINYRNIEDLYNFMLLSTADKIVVIRADYIDKKKSELQSQLDAQDGNKTEWEAEIAKLNQY